MGALPYNIELPVLSHRQSLNAPRHELAACSPWSQAVDPFWRADKVFAKFYPSNSYPVNSCVWHHRLGAIQSGSKGCIGRNVVVLLCAWLICFDKQKCIQSTDVLPDGVKFPVLSHRHSPNPPLHKLPVCGRWSQVLATHLESRKDSRRVLPVACLPGEFLCVTSPISVQSSRPAKAVYMETVTTIALCMSVLVTIHTMMRLS